MEDNGESKTSKQKEIRAKIQQLKKSVPKGDKKKKKEVAEEVAKLEEALAQLQMEKHEPRTEKATPDDTDEPQNDAPQSTAEISVEERAKKPNRQQQRKLKKKAAMEKEIEEARNEALNAVDYGKLEKEQFDAIFSTEGLALKEIPADGNCFYNAIVDQLRLEANNSDIQNNTYKHYRKIVSDYLKDHPDDFMPFLSGANGDTMSEAEFNEYCKKIAETGEWAGNVEIQALSQALKRKIIIYQAGTKPLVIGEEHEGKPLRLSYHRHQYGLGEHYNSLKVVKTKDESI
ncbi:hypothetical protein MP638_006561 [Amoeboaphelidium occidentale]|nr:hypothetical protein MP638_006561 [Amoeboaphelidium occidentale]